MDFCRAHIGRNLDARNGDIAYARIAQLHEDRAAHDLTDGFGGFEKSAARHCLNAQGASDLLNAISFQQVVLLDVVESIETDTAFHTAADFLGVILLTLERTDAVVANRLVVAINADAAFAFYRSLHHLATCS